MKKIKFFFTSGYHLQITFLLGIGTRVYFSLFNAGTWICEEPESDTILSVNSYFIRLVLPGVCSFCGVIPSPSALEIFPFPLLCSSLIQEGRISWRCQFRAECFLVSYSLCIVHLWVSVLVTIYCERKLLRRWVSKGPVELYSRMS